MKQAHYFLFVMFYCGVVRKYPNMSWITLYSCSDAFVFSQIADPSAIRHFTTICVFKFPQRRMSTNGTIFIFLNQKGFTLT